MVRTMISQNGVIAICLAILAAAWGPGLAGPAIGRLEGRLAPVLDPSLTILRIERLAEYESRVEGEAVKVRGRCDYVAGSLEWHLGSPGRSVRVPAEFRDPPTLRRAGRTGWTGIVVGLAPDQLTANSFATVRHRCGWWGHLWETESLFFTSGPGA